MGFRFIHTADWQIGKVFRFLDGAEMGGLQLARLDAITRIGNLAGEHDVRHVLVAGDVYDHATPSPHTRNQVVERMRAYTPPYSGTCCRGTMIRINPTDSGTSSEGAACLTTSTCIPIRPRPP